MKDDDLKKVLGFDPLANAEKVAGKSYKEDKGVEALGLISHMAHNQAKDEILRELHDTTFSMNLDEYMEIVKEEGFKIIYAEAFRSSYHEKTEMFFIMWHNDGILLVFDTYGGDSVNGGHFYYNWEQTNWSEESRGVTSSGGYETIEKDENGNIERGLWYGDHDCREALRFHIRQLRKYGNFVFPWKKKPFLWLLHYEDVNRIKKEKGDYDTFSEKRFQIVSKIIEKKMGKPILEA